MQLLLIKSILLINPVACFIYYAQAGSNHLLREYTCKEAKISELKVTLVGN